VSGEDRADERRRAEPPGGYRPSLRRLGQLEPRGRVVTIGTFDGVHLGHRSLLSRARGRARELGVSTLAVTFEPLPAMVLRPERFLGRLCTPEEKLDRLYDGGADEVVTLEFSRDFSQQSPEEFLAALGAAARPVEVLVGEAFALGKDRAGNVARLGEIAGRLGFVVRAVPRLTDGETVISSSVIREAITEGDVRRAWRYLGRPFRVSGPVVHGAHFGRTIGYPTANVVPPRELVGLADGIYASFAILPDGRGPRPAMTYVGSRPTVNTGDRLIETHLLDFSADLYGRELQVDVVERLRADEQFATVEAMVAQLRLDEANARTTIAALGSSPTPAAAGGGV
jgi:riboflavin kinase/FMN adenylyltransferase